MQSGEERVSDLPEHIRFAVTRAYNTVLADEPATDTVAFEAAVMVYRRLDPDVSEQEARDRIADIIAESISRRAMEWVTAPNDRTSPTRRETRGSQSDDGRPEANES